MTLLKKAEDIIAAGEGMYSNPKFFADGSNACLGRFMFTVAIIHNVDEFGYQRRWCYNTFIEANGALENWDGKAKPKDFIVEK